MNRIIPHLTASEHFGPTCAFWNSHDDWFLQRDQIKAHLYNGSLRLVDIIDAMKPGKVCEEFCFNLNWHSGFPAGLSGLFKRHDYNLRALFNELRDLKWQQRRHWKTQEPLVPSRGSAWQEFKLPEIITQLPDFSQLTGKPGESIELYRTELRSVRVWSPFAKVNPLSEKPKKWTVTHVVRALLSGQFTNLKCEGKYSDDYAYDAAVNFHIGDFSTHAVAFARRILESPSGWWAYQRDGHDDNCVSICCHHFDSNSFTFNLMKRFNPAASAAPTMNGDAVTIERPVETATELKRKRASSAAAIQSTVTVVTLSINTGRNLVELRFPGKPDEDVRAEMKAAKFRWYGPAGCWYHKHTPENLAWAQAFVSRQAGRPAPTVAVMQPPTPVAVVSPEVAAAFGMEKLPNVRIVTPQVAPLQGMTPLGVPAWRQRFHR